MRKLETLATVLALLSFACLTLAAVLLVVLVRQVFLFFDRMRQALHTGGHPARATFVQTLESPIAHAPFPDSALPLLHPVARLRGRT